MRRVVGTADYNSGSALGHLIRPLLIYRFYLVVYNVITGKDGNFLVRLYSNSD
jgi:hypothetical protein